MRQKLQQLGAKALALIKDPSLNDPGMMARLGPIPARIQRLDLQFQELEQEAVQIEELIERFSRSPHRANGSPNHEPTPDAGSLDLGRRALQTKLRIEVDGAVLGKPGEQQVISDHKAS